MVIERKILSPQDMNAWTVSCAYEDIVTFIQSVSRHVTSKPIKPNLPVSQAITSVVDLLKELIKMIDSFPAEEQPQRFGNKAFRSWFNWLKQNASDLCKSMLFAKNEVKGDSLSISVDEGLEEVAGYLVESVGNSTRIDYGTGHELAFIAFLICLFKMGILRPPTSGGSVPGQINDHAAVGLVVMPAYLRLVRRLQLYYRMEPAGSHGVWCLDDFQFVPFIWGSSQLIGHDQYGPSSIPDSQIASNEKDAYLLFSCIDYIYQMKTGPFAEHSNTLYGIAQVHSWEKVQSGLIKMYKGEVLAKFPVIQHFLFGHLLSFDKASSKAPATNVVRPSMPPPSQLPQ